MKIHFLDAQIIDVQTKKGISKSGKEWKSADVLISHEDNNYSLNAFGSLSDGLVIGCSYDFFCELKTQEYQGKHYTKIELNAHKQRVSEEIEKAYESPKEESVAGEEEDLPF